MLGVPETNDVQGTCDTARSLHGAVHKHAHSLYTRAQKARLRGRLVEQTAICFSRFVQAAQSSLGVRNCSATRVRAGRVDV